MQKTKTIGLYLFTIFSLIYIYWIQNIAIYTENAFSIFLFSYSIISLWFIFLIISFYSLIKSFIINKDKQMKSLHLFIFIFIFSILFLYQNIETIFLYNAGNFLLTSLYIIILLIALYLIYFIYKQLNNNKGKNKILTLWGILIFIYIFILSTPNIPHIPNALFTKENNNEYLIISSNINNDSSENKILINSYPNNRINIPFIINFSELYHYEKTKIFYSNYHNLVPIIIFPKFGKEILTNFYMKNLIYNNYIFTKTKNK